MPNLYRRGQVYWARAQRGGHEHRRSLKTGTRAVAERRLREWLDELDATAWGDKPRRTFDEASRQFTTDHLPLIKPSSRKRYGVSLGHLALAFAGKFMHQIDAAEMLRFETQRRHAGVSNSTIRRDLQCLSSVFTSCEDWGWIDAGRNPVPAHLGKRAKRGLKEGEARTRYLSEVEEAAMIASATPANQRTKAGRQAGKWTMAREAIILAIDTGLRREEQFALRWPQVDFERGVIRTGTATKSGRERLVPLPERSRTILGTLPRHIDSDYVFVNPETGTRFLQMNKGFKAAAHRAKIEDVRWHDLRRTAGCRWLQRDGKRMEEVSILLGHSSVQVTEQRYAFLEAEAVAQSLSGRTNSGTRPADSNPENEQKQKVA